MFTFPTPTGAHSHLHRGFAVIDLETTGFDARGTDRIVEIAIVRSDAFGRELGVFETLVNPLRAPGPTSVHGIRSAMLHDAPTFPEIARSILAWLDGVIVVAHNARFEEAFLSAEFHRSRIRVPRLPALDTLPLAQQNLLLPNHRLATVCQWAGVDVVGAHTALGDALATAQMLPDLLAEVGPQRWQHAMPELDYHVSGRYSPRPRESAALT